MFSGVIRDSVVIIGVVTLILTSAPTITAKSDRPSLGVISIGMTEAEVRKRLGRPLKSSHSQCGRDHFAYSKGDVGTQDGFVYYVTTQSPSWKTKKGIKVGDVFSKAQKVYSFKKTSTLEFESEFPTGETLYLYINQKQKIEKISVRKSSVC
jgi:hypothetical protein